MGKFESTRCAEKHRVRSPTPLFISIWLTQFSHYEQIQSVSQESKEWVEKNRVCDAPGSWFCRGQYPPALKKVLAEKKDFKQLEDFNLKGKLEDDSAYQNEYFNNLLGDKKNQPVERERAKRAKLSPEQIDLINEEWMNNEMTSMMYEMIAADSFDELKEILMVNPQLAHIRSEDGRGPMWWAHEFKRPKIIKMLKTLGVSESRTDENGKAPLDT
jgi:dolichyl-diphosphooligosaccharide---protein glycosyltransferase